MYTLLSPVSHTSSRLPEIPRLLEIEEGWEVSLLRMNVARFQVFELPTQSFWMVSLNPGVGLGFQSLNGLLFIDDEECTPREGVPPAWLGAFQYFMALSVIVIGSLSIYLTVQEVKTTPSLAPKTRSITPRVDSALPMDLYAVGASPTSQRKE